jgi:hypothetical protein
LHQAELLGAQNIYLHQAELLGGQSLINDRLTLNIISNTIIQKLTFTSFFATSNCCWAISIFHISANIILLFMIHNSIT